MVRRERARGRWRERKGRRKEAREGERETGLRLFFQVSTDYTQVRAFLLQTETHYLFLFPGPG